MKRKRVFKGLGRKLQRQEILLDFTGKISKEDFAKFNKWLDFEMKYFGWVVNRDYTEEKTAELSKTFNADLSELLEFIGIKRSVRDNYVDIFIETNYSLMSISFLYKFVSPKTPVYSYCCHLTRNGNTVWQSGFKTLLNIFKKSGYEIKEDAKLFRLQGKAKAS